MINRLIRIKWLQVTLVLAILASMGLTWEAWIQVSGRNLQPIWEGLPGLRSPYDMVLAGSLGFFLVLYLFLRKSQFLPFLIIGLMLALAVLDLQRWEPWYYQYVLMLLALTVFPRLYYTYQDTAWIIYMMQFLISGVYIWSGVHQLSGWFADQPASALTQEIIATAPHFEAYSTLFGFWLPMTEILIGFGLLFVALRKFTIPLMLAFHATWLFILSPYQSGIHPELLPWHGAMIVFVLLMFAGVKGSWADRLKCFKVKRYRVVMSLIWLLPVIHWSGYPAVDLTSHSQPEFVVEGFKFQTEPSESRYSVIPKFDEAEVALN